jgi:hypothetical protein
MQDNITLHIMKGFLLLPLAYIQYITYMLIAHVEQCMDKINNIRQENILKFRMTIANF